MKITILIIVLAVIIGGIAGLIHLRKVNEHNEAELSQYTQPEKFSADLGKVLVVYFSHSGHTADIASQIAHHTAGDYYEIKTKNSYWAPFMYFSSKYQLATKKYPQIEENLPNLQQYDTIFVGAPVWWYTMAPPMFSYLLKTDFAGKRVVPFSTQGSNVGNFYNDFTKLAKNANLLTSADFNNVPTKYEFAVKNKVIHWLNGLSR